MINPKYADEIDASILSQALEQVGLLLGNGHGTDSFLYEGTSFAAQDVTAGQCADVFGGANVVLGSFTN